MKKELERQIRTIDAEGKSPGRLATQVVSILMGKGKTTFVSNVDNGDAVEVLHASKMKITGKKLEQKQYFHHTTRASGLKTTTMKKVWAENPADVLIKAVSRMLPKNSYRNVRLKRFVVKN